MTLTSPAIPLRRFTRNAVQALNLLAVRARDCSIRIDDTDGLLTLEPLPGKPPGSIGDWLLKMQWAGARLALSLPESAPDLWLRSRFPDIDLPALPAPLAAATLESALGNALALVQGLGRGPAQIDSLEAGTELPSLDHHFALTLRQKTQVLHATLACDSLGLMLMAGLVAQMSAASNQVCTDALPILLRAEIGRSTLPAGTLAALQLHDTILIENAWLSQSNEIWLGQDSFGVRARLDDHQLTITQSLSESGLKMTTPEPTELNAATPVTLDSIPVRVSFDLGERSLTLAELKTLQPGQTLDLGQALDTAVNIRANGALIGKGMLIDLDGQLGVTITALAEGSQ